MWQGDVDLGVKTPSLLPFEEDAQDCRAALCSWEPDAFLSCLELGSELAQGQHASRWSFRLAPGLFLSSSSICKNQGYTAQSPPLGLRQLLFDLCVQ